MCIMLSMLMPKRMKEPIFSLAEVREAVGYRMSVGFIISEQGVFHTMKVLKITERMMVWASLNFLYPSLMVIMMIRSNILLGSSKLRSYGVCMTIVKIRKLNMLLLSSRAMLCFGGKIL